MQIGELLPNIFYPIPNSNEFACIELRKSYFIVKGISDDEARKLLELARRGLEIMQVFKQIDPSLNLSERYSRTVCDNTSMRSDTVIDCLPEALKRLKRYVGDEN